MDPVASAFSTAPLAHPTFASVAPWAARLAHLRDWPSVDELDALLADRLGLPPALRLEAQAPIPRRRRGARPDRREEIYELRIHAHRRLPTRPGSWHDLANALVWCAFPQAKRALTARQHAIVTARVAADATRLPATRTREQDALAMLDEGGVLLLGDRPDELEAALRAGDAERLRAADVVPLVYGHALLEHIATRGGDVRGYAVVCAGAPAAPPLARIAEADAALAAAIGRPELFAAPEPLLGVNDFDDPGRAPVALDADHFFTELRLRYQNKDKLVDKLVRRYADVVAQQAFWGQRVDGDHVYVRVRGARYLLRALGNLQTIDLAALGKVDRKQALSAMASYLAGVHRPGWKGVAPDEIAARVSADSKVLAKVYTKSWKALQ